MPEISELINWRAPAQSNATTAIPLASASKVTFPNVSVRLGNKKMSPLA
jgi:hypothetical protein